MLPIAIISGAVTSSSRARSSCKSVRAPDHSHWTVRFFLHLPHSSNERPLNRCHACSTSRLAPHLRQTHPSQSCSASRFLPHREQRQPSQLCPSSLVVRQREHLQPSHECSSPRTVPQTLHVQPTHMWASPRIFPHRSQQHAFHLCSMARLSPQIEQLSTHLSVHGTYSCPSGRTTPQCRHLQPFQLCPNKHLRFTVERWSRKGFLPNFPTDVVHVTWGFLDN